MRRWLTLLVLLCGATSAAWANSVTIGQLQYLGTNAQRISAFKVILDPTGVTSAQLNLSNLPLAVKGSLQSAGAIMTPTTLLFLGGPGLALPSCPCQVATLNIFLSNNNKPIRLSLANGQFLTVPGLTTIALTSPGGRNLEPGATVPVTLTAVPEPGSIALMTTGFGMLGYQLRRGRMLGRRSASSL